MKIARTTLFLKCLKKLGASETDLKKLEEEIASNPEAGDVIQGMDGARKIRFGLKGKGKRGGGRAIYVVIRVNDTAYLMYAYSKAQQEDLSAAQREAILTILKGISDG